MVGRVFTTNTGGDCVVLEYESCRNVKVKFLDKHGYTTNTTSRVLKIGKLFNPFAPSIHGVGFMGVGIYTSHKDGKKTEEYQDWVGMICRSYSDKFHTKQPTYGGCKVCEEWHNFQNFAEWRSSVFKFERGYQLDKDLLSKGNKIYSPETCVYVPSQINSVLTNSKGLGKNFPVGVRLCKTTKKYTARLSKFGKEIHLGNFTTPAEAFKAYKTAKEDYVKEVARLWEGKVDNRVYERLISWTLN